MTTTYAQGSIVHIHANTLCDVLFQDGWYERNISCRKIQVRNYDSLQLPVPTIIFVQLSQNQYDVDDVDNVISNIRGWKSTNCASSVANCTAEIVQSSNEEGKYTIHYEDGNHERILVQNNFHAASHEDDEDTYMYCYDGIYLSRFGIIDDDRYDDKCNCYRCHNGAVYWNDAHGGSECREHDYERYTSHYREYCEYEFYTEQRGRRRKKNIRFTQCGFESNYTGRFVERQRRSGFNWQNVCFPGHSLARTSDGSVRRLDMLRRGDLVLSGDGKIATIDAIVKTTCFQGQIELVTLNRSGLQVTPWHPLRTTCSKDKKDAVWVFPSTLVTEGKATKKIVSCDAVYSIMLSEGHYSMMIENVECITLGHNILNDSVASHSFYGTDEVRRNIMELDMNDNGVVELQGGSCVQRNRETGLVCRLYQRRKKEYGGAGI
jgi:hypothetical protein